MKIIYTDENKRLKDFGEMIDSYNFQKFVNSNIKRLTKYEYSETRVKPYLCKNIFNEFFEENDFLICGKTEHANNIGNNNMTYVQDLKSREYIGAINLNSDMYGGVYCYATDINENNVSNSYFISKRGIRCSSDKYVDWNKYIFTKEAEVLKLVEKALSYGVLQSGPEDGIIVIKTHKGREFHALISKEEAVKGLIRQDQVHLIEEAIKKIENSYVFSEYGQSLYNNMKDIYNRELSKLGRFEGTCICEGCIKTLEEVAGWYLLTYDSDALEILDEHASVSSATFYGFEYKEIRAILEKCFEPVKTLDCMIFKAERKTIQDNISEKYQDNEFSK